jgi:hypothetical protein
MIYCYHFPEKSIYYYTYLTDNMEGVLMQLRWPRQKRPKTEMRVFPSYRLDSRILELETAKEILREVFGTTSAEVEEMIKLRLADREAL